MMQFVHRGLPAWLLCWNKWVYWARLFIFKPILFLSPCYEQPLLIVKDQREKVFHFLQFMEFFSKTSCTDNPHSWKVLTSFIMFIDHFQRPQLKAIAMNVPSNGQLIFFKKTVIWQSRDMNTKRKSAYEF